jgi:hypothetical protein
MVDFYKPYFGSQYSEMTNHPKMLADVPISNALLICAATHRSHASEGQYRKQHASQPCLVLMPSRGGAPHVTDHTYITILAS